MLARMAMRGDHVRALPAAAVLLMLAACSSGSSASGTATSGPAPSSSGPTTFSLQLRPVLDVVVAAPGACPEPGTSPSPEAAATLCAADAPQGPRLQYSLAAAELTGAEVASVEAADSMGGVDVLITLTDQGAAAFADLTSRLMALPDPQNQLAIVVAGEVQNAPSVQARIDGGALVISGFTTEAEAQAAIDSITG